MAPHMFIRGCACSLPKRSAYLPDHVLVHTNGAYLGNTGPWDYGVVMRYGGHNRDSSGSVRLPPTRIKCAVLAWHTRNAAIEGKDDSVTTE